VRIYVGLVGASRAWEQVFLQEGVPYGSVDLRAGLLKENCSVLVVNRSLSGAERDCVEQYLREGGALLGSVHSLSQISGIGSRKERVDYILSEHDMIFLDVSLMDLAVVGEISKEANMLRTQADTNAVFAGPLGGGYAVALPFDLDEALFDTRVANKNFYARIERLPSERVSLVSKGEVRHLVHRSLEYLHHVRGMWYAHLWTFPGENENIFVFRVDTDRSQRTEIDALYEIARRRQCSLSWYLDVRSHEGWLKHFQTLVSQEFGVHCYEHQVFPTVDANLKNIARATREMHSAGLHPQGFAAPFGIWTPELAQSLDRLGFEYSSEFSYAYDTFPLYPELPAGRCTTLQVPIHPICIGSLLRVGYSDSQMKEYFKMVIDYKWLRNEPLFFYHHPLHGQWSVAEMIFDCVLQYPVQNMTLGEYARWWKRREMLKMTIDVESAGITSILSSSSAGGGAADVRLRVSNPRGDYAFVPLEGRTGLTSAANWSQTSAPLPPPSDIRRIREFDLRGMLGNLYTTMTRKSR
jgi:hypothetical protein